MKRRNRLATYLPLWFGGQAILPWSIEVHLGRSYSPLGISALVRPASLPPAFVCCSKGQLPPQHGVVGHHHAIGKQHHQAPVWTRGTLHASTGKQEASSSPILDGQDGEVVTPTARRELYLKGLMRNLTLILDQWILSGRKSLTDQAYNILDQIQQHQEATTDPLLLPPDASCDHDFVLEARRLINRAGLPPRPVSLPGPSNNAQERREEAMARQKWEQQQQQQQRDSSDSNLNMAAKSEGSSLRTDPAFLANDTKYMQEAMRPTTQLSPSLNKTFTVAETAAAKVAAIVANSGLVEMPGESLGIGGLDDVLQEIKRRVLIPYCVPPILLKELGIQPVRGLLLYGSPGNGKTLLARTLGKLLSPLRPPTVVSGPEVMDKFVGSSEKNVRALFDSPPDIYDRYRIGQPDGGTAMAQAALHVIIMDEFDAIARSRGGRGGQGSDQGDAGVARDSVVNQLLAKLDGVEPLMVPTLVIGLTNQLSLIDQALLRPGRFEVQIEVPSPRTIAQRVSILHVHTKGMFGAGRLLVRDAPPGSPAAVASLSNEQVARPLYEELMEFVARSSEGFSGAQLAAVARAAASHALERTVQAIARHTPAQDELSLFQNCIVTMDDFKYALEDVSPARYDESQEEINQVVLENTISDDKK